MPPFASGSATEASPRHPDVNQDAFAVDEKRQLLMVADGMSGSAKGETVSAAARDAVVEFGDDLDEMIQDACDVSGSPYLTLDEASSVMDAHFRMIADRAWEASIENKFRSVRPTTTLMTAKLFEIAPAETYAIVKSVGDCQSMVLRADGELERVNIEEDGKFAERIRRGQLTEDEADIIVESGSPTEAVRTFLQYLAGLGQVDASVPAMILDEISLEMQWNLIPDSVRIKARSISMLTRAYFSGERSSVTAEVGLKPGSELRVHSATIRINPGDRLFLATDGIDALRRAQIREALLRGTSIGEQTRALVEDAKEANKKEDMRAKPDDITVIGMETPGVREAFEQMKTESSKRLAEASRVQADARRIEVAREKAVSIAERQ